METRSDPECSSPTLNKHENTAARISKAQTTCMCLFCLGNVKFLQTVYLLNVRLEHSRSNLVFEICNNFFFGILYRTCYKSHSNLDELGYPGSESRKEVKKRHKILRSIVMCSELNVTITFLNICSLVCLVF